MSSLSHSLCLHGNDKLKASTTIESAIVVNAMDIMLSVCDGR